MNWRTIRRECLWLALSVAMIAAGVIAGNLIGGDSPWRYGPSYILGTLYGCWRPRESH